MTLKIFSNIEEKDSSLVLYYTSSHGYDIKLAVEKKEDTKISGSLDTGVMGTLAVKDERMKENN